MVFRCLQAVLAMLVIGLLSSCSLTGRQPIQRPLYYDVRDVVVIADARVPRVLIAGVDRRIAEAIGATRRPVALPRVILAVRIEDYASSGIFGDRRPRTTFRVTATSVDNGLDVAAGTFTVFSSTDMTGFAEESLAEEVAARVRFAFSLSTPPVVRRDRVRRTSTRMQAETARPAAVEAPAADAPMPAVPAAPTPTPAQPSPQPSAPAAGKVTPAGPEAGTNIEDGANGAIKLENGVPVCDPKEDPECQVPAQ